VIADGHHRYETALAYQDERRGERGGAPGDDDFLLTYLVELTDDQLSIGPIHRLVSGLPSDFDPLGALPPSFEVVDGGGAPGPELLDRMNAEGALGLVTPRGAWLVRPRAGEPGGRNGRGPDAVLLDELLAAWPRHETTYPFRAADVLAAVGSGSASAGLLLRPATVEQIASAARAGRRMPQKTTFFRPKLRTGLVFRRLTD
jgi:hypothetical protein